MLEKSIMEEFMKNWNYLNSLEMVYYSGISEFEKCLDIEVVMVNPESMEVDVDDVLNTKVQVWLEFGGIKYYPELKGIVARHNAELDCGADTFEEAIIELGRLCKEKQYKTITG